MSDHFIRRATLRDVKYLDALQAKATRQVGFLPFSAIEAYIRDSTVLIGTQNMADAGYLLGRSDYRRTPHIAMIHQALVQYDARRNSLGRSMLREYVRRLPATTRLVDLWCASDLDANAFWHACGFIAIAWRRGSHFHDRHHVLWRLPIGDVLPMAVHIPPSSNSRGMIRGHRDIVPLMPGTPWTSVPT